MLHARTSGLARFIRPGKSNRTGYLPKKLGFSPPGISRKIYNQSIIFDTTIEVLLDYMNFGFSIYRFVISSDIIFWFQRKEKKWLIFLLGVMSK